MKKRRKQQDEDTTAEAFLRQDEENDSPVAGGASAAGRKADAEDTDGMEEVVKRFVDEEENDELGEISFKSFLGGDLLGSRFFQRQVIFILFVAGLMILYTGNRYSSQQEIITIDSLKEQLQRERYNVLTQSSELLNLSRQSNIERTLRANGDSAIVNPTTPPYEIIADE